MTTTPLDPRSYHDVYGTAPPLYSIASVTALKDDAERRKSVRCCCLVCWVITLIIAALAALLFWVVYGCDNMAYTDVGEWTLTLPADASALSLDLYSPRGQVIVSVDGALAANEIRVVRTESSNSSDPTATTGYLTEPEFRPATDDATAYTLLLWGPTDSNFVSSSFSCHGTAWKVYLPTAGVTPGVFLAELNIAVASGHWHIDLPAELPFAAANFESDLANGSIQVHNLTVGVLSLYSAKVWQLIGGPFSGDDFADLVPTDTNSENYFVPVATSGVRVGDLLATTVSGNIYLHDVGCLAAGCISDVDHGFVAEATNGIIEVLWPADTTVTTVPKHIYANVTSSSINISRSEVILIQGPSSTLLSDFTFDLTTSRVSKAVVDVASDLTGLLALDDASSTYHKAGSFGAPDGSDPATIEASILVRNVALRLVDAI
jgi:hypothetical protein